MDAIKFVHEQLTPKRELPKFRAGDGRSSLTITLPRATNVVSSLSVET